MEPVLPATAALLSATIRRTAPAIPQADNLGGSNDERDLYYLLDYLTFAVDRAYPQIPCAQGCSHCCESQLFRVTEAEWLTVRRGLDELPAPARAAALERARSTFGPHREKLVRMAGLWTTGERVTQADHVPGTRTCPLLVDGRCSIYEHRPAICRGYGYFSATVEGEARLLICQQFGPGWIAQLEESGVDQLPMPNWNPVQRTLEALSPGRPIKPLPLWLLELAEEEADQAAAREP